MVRLISVVATSGEMASVACSDEAKSASLCTSDAFDRVMTAPREMMPAQQCEVRFPIMTAPWSPVVLREFDGGERLPVPRVPINFAAGPASIIGIRI
jgi:hypothetical protein